MTGPIGRMWPLLLPFGFTNGQIGRLSNPFPALDSAAFLEVAAARPPMVPMFPAAPMLPVVRPAAAPGYPFQVAASGMYPGPSAPAIAQLPGRPSAPATPLRAGRPSAPVTPLRAGHPQQLSSNVWPFATNEGNLAMMMPMFHMFGMRGGHPPPDPSVIHQIRDTLKRAMPEDVTDFQKAVTYGNLIAGMGGVHGLIGHTLKRLAGCAQDPMMTGSAAMAKMNPFAKEE